MANLREHVFNNQVSSVSQVMIVQGSPTGREQLSLFGALGGATIEVQKQLVLSDGTLSPIRTIATYNDEINIEIAVGKNNNLFVRLENMTPLTDLVCKCAVLN